MAHYVKGDKVANATSYELFKEKVGIEQTYSWVQGAIQGTGAENTLNTFIKTDFIRFDKETRLKFVTTTTYLIYIAVYNGSKTYIERPVINRDPETKEVFAEAVYTFEPDKYYKISIGTVVATDPLNIASARDYAKIYGGNGDLVSVGTATEINFNLSEFEMEAGDYNLMVQAHADGYESSDLSNPVVYSVT